MFSLPDPDVDYTTLNQIFQNGDGITVSVSEIAKEDNLALTFVHGTGKTYDDPENNFWLNKPRFRYGSTSSTRDFTAFVSLGCCTVVPLHVLDYLRALCYITPFVCLSLLEIDWLMLALVKYFDKQSPPLSLKLWYEN